MYRVSLHCFLESTYGPFSVTSREGLAGPAQVHGGPAAGRGGGAAPGPRDQGLPRAGAAASAHCERLGAAKTTVYQNI